jgi:5-methylcytosine-specific restriction endonuclease McrA
MGNKKKQLVSEIKEEWEYIEMYEGYSLDCWLSNKGLYVNMSNPAVSILVSKNSYKEWGEHKEHLLNICECSLCGDKIKLNNQECQCQDSMVAEGAPGPYFFPGINSEDDPAYLLIKNLRQRSNNRTVQRNRRKLAKESGGEIGKSTIKTLWGIQEGRCYYCLLKLGEIIERENYHVDHIKPLAKGGQHDPLNLALACAKCNQQKHKKTEKAFIEMLTKKKGAEWAKEQRKFARNFGRLKKENFSE